MLHLFVRVKGEHIDRVFVNRKDYTKMELENLIREKCQHLSTEEQDFILRRGEILLEKEELILECEEDVEISCNYKDIRAMAHEKDKIQIFPWAWYHVERHQSFLEKVKDFFL